MSLSCSELINKNCGQFRCR